jgi:DNA mismatch repair protein MSH5
VIVIEKFMRVTTATMKSIGVFEDESHPNTFQDYRVKEGMSLFNLLCHTKTPMGRVMLREWCKKPLFDLEKINERLDVVEFFCDFGKSLDIDSLSKQLKLVSNFPSFMETPIKSCQQWKSICKSLIALSAICEITRPFSNLDFTSTLIDSIPCLDIARNIENVVDFQLSKDQDRVVIKRGVDPVVDEWKSRYEQLPNLLCECADQIARQLSTDLNASLQVVYFPQMGYIVGFETDHLDLRQVLEEPDLYGNPSEFEFVARYNYILYTLQPIFSK